MKVISNSTRKAIATYVGFVGFIFGLLIQAPVGIMIASNGFPYYGRWALFTTWMIIGVVLDFAAFVLLVGLGRRWAGAGLIAALLPTAGYVVALPVALYVTDWMDPG